MEEMTYYSVAAKWWADKVREANKDYPLGLSEENFKDFEEKLADQIKENVEYLINDYQEYNKKHPDNIREFMGIQLNTKYGILVETLHSSPVELVRVVLPTSEMLVSPNLVFIRELRIWEYKKFDKPFVDSDQVIFDAS